MDHFENDVYFLNTELKLIKLELKLGGRLDYQETIVNIADKIEDFYIDPVIINGKKECKIIYITDKGLIKEFGEHADPNKVMDCTKHTQNVNYWNKVVKVGNCILAAGMVYSSPHTNTLVLTSSNEQPSLLHLPASSTPLLTKMSIMNKQSVTFTTPSCECLRSLVKSIRKLLSC